ncbi:MAG: hypothetical protein JWM09_1310 [Francisellaceae bacterium]|nr:hypothetical protein [Francisellaceae bacterium]
MDALFLDDELMSINELNTPFGLRFLETAKPKKDNPEKPSELTSYPTGTNTPVGRDVDSSFDG